MGGGSREFQTLTLIMDTVDAVNTNFTVFGLTQTGIKPQSTVSAAGALFN